MKKSFKEILKSSIAKVVGLALVVGMSVSILTACGQQTNNGGKANPTKTETDKEKDPKQEIIVNPTDPEKEDPKPEDPGKEDPEPENPENPEQPGKEDPENPEQPGKEDPENPDDPQPEDPEDPKPEDPDDPQTEDPQDEELDFSALEAKLEEVILSTGRNMQINELISYSFSNSKLNILVDMTKSGAQLINLYTATLTSEYNLHTQADIDNLVNSLNKNMLDKTSGGATKTDISFVKASSDITVDGVTYSKDGIEGDNIFAEQCGVENAVMTYVANPGSGNNFDSRFSTGYSKPVQILTIVENSNSIEVKVNLIDVESYSGYSNDQIYKNLTINEKRILKSEQTFDLGQNLKSEPEIQAYNAAWMLESEEEIDYVQDALDYVYENIETFKIKETR